MGPRRWHSYQRSPYPGCRRRSLAEASQAWGLGWLRRIVEPVHAGA